MAGISILVQANGESSRIRQYLGTNKLNLFVAGGIPLSNLLDATYSVLKNARDEVLLCCNDDVWTAVHNKNFRCIKHLSVPPAETRMQSVYVTLIALLEKHNGLDRSVLIADCDTVFTAKDTIRRLVAHDGNAVSVRKTEDEDRRHLRNGYVEINRSDIVIAANEKIEHLPYLTTGLYKINSAMHFCKWYQNNFTDITRTPDSLLLALFDQDNLKAIPHYKYSSVSYGTISEYITNADRIPVVLNSDQSI